MNPAPVRSGRPSPRPSGRSAARVVPNGWRRSSVIIPRQGARMTALHLTALHDSIERACWLVARSQWDRKAAAHAEIFSLLADVVDDPALAPLLSGARGMCGS